MATQPGLHFVSKPFFFFCLLIYGPLLKRFVPLGWDGLTELERAFSDNKRVYYRLSRNRKGKKNLLLLTQGKQYHPKLLSTRTVRCVSSFLVQVEMRTWDLEDRNDLVIGEGTVNKAMRSGPVPASGVRKEFQTHVERVGMEWAEQTRSPAPQENWRAITALA